MKGAPSRGGVQNILYILSCVPVVLRHDHSGRHSPAFLLVLVRGGVSHPSRPLEHAPEVWWYVGVGVGLCCGWSPARSAGYAAFIFPASPVKRLRRPHAWACYAAHRRPLRGSGHRTAPRSPPCPCSPDLSEAWVGTRKGEEEASPNRCAFSRMDSPPHGAPS